jgi:hypothetical protein
MEWVFDNQHEAAEVVAHHSKTPTIIYVTKDQGVDDVPADDSFEAAGNDEFKLRLRWRLRF